MLFFVLFFFSVEVDNSIHSAYFQMPLDYYFNVICHSRTCWLPSGLGHNQIGND